MASAHPETSPARGDSPAAVVRVGVATLVFAGVVSLLGGSTQNALACLYAAAHVVLVATGEPFDGQRYLRRHVWLCAACAVAGTLAALWVQAGLFAAVAVCLVRIERLLTHRHSPTSGEDRAICVSADT